MKYTACILTSLLPLLSFSSYAEEVLRPIAQVEARAINEMSGITHSQQWPGVYWVHNDSGDDARIFALDEYGKNIIPASAQRRYFTEVQERGKRAWRGFTIESARNRDWEDITNNDGVLYIADLGNNSNRRRNLMLYRLPEFDPSSSYPSTEVIAIPVRYPDQQQFPAEKWHFDSESLFAADGKLYLITKHRVAKIQRSSEPGAKLYRLDTEFTDRDNILTYISSHAELTSATGAELSPDGQTLAVVSYNALWLFDRPDTGDDWLASESKKIPLRASVFRQVEAVSWIDNDRLILTNEQRDLFHIEASEAQ